MTGYRITPEQAASITDVEMAFSTKRLLPAWEHVPAEFRVPNAYAKLVEDLFFGRLDPGVNIEIHDGFAPEHVNRVVRAHLCSFGPKHEHKIAGVAYMLSLMATLTAAAAEPEA